MSEAVSAWHAQRFEGYRSALLWDLFQLRLFVLLDYNL